MWIKFAKALFKVSDIETADSYTEANKFYIRIKALNRMLIEEQENMDVLNARLDELCDHLNEEEKKVND